MAKSPGTYETRRHQIEAFAREVAVGKVTLPEALKAAALVGAAEERHRTLGYIQAANMLDDATKRYLTDFICGTAVLEVLGYEQKGG